MALSDYLRWLLAVALTHNDAADQLADVIDANTASVAELDQELDAIDIVTIEATVDVTNAVSTAIATQVPAGAVITAVQSRIDETVVGDASGDNLLAKIGIGTASDPDLFGLSADLVAGTKTAVLPDYAVQASALTVSVYACKTDGSACTEKFEAGSGQVVVVITYRKAKDLPDAS